MIALGCCIFGILTCASRTIMLCSLICHITYYLLTHQIKKKVLSIITFLGVFYMCFLYIPFIHDSLQFIGTIFESKENSDVGGSSLEMRLGQLVTVLYYIQGHLLFGRGYDFFNVDLGWSDGMEGLVDKDLFGLEGVQFALLLERGVIGLLIYVVFWISMLCIFFQMRKKDKHTGAMCISIIIGYLMFSAMTGELGSLFFMGLILGMGMKMLYLIDHYQQDKL